MICLIAGTAVHAAKWAKSQNLRDDEWFYAASLFDIVSKKGYFHTILVPDGIEYISNDHLNRFLTAAWENGRRK